MGEGEVLSKASASPAKMRKRRLDSLRVLSSAAQARHQHQNAESGNN
jgi:hypothetical protein